MVDFLNNPQVTPGLGTQRTMNVYRVTMAGEQYEPIYGIIDSTKSRDPGNTGYPQYLRPGLMLGLITASKKWAPSILGVVAEAYDGSTTVSVSAAVATELVRRVGATGTFKLTGPATAAGTVRTLTATYSNVDTSTGEITVTALSVNEVQTVNFNIASTGGTVSLLVPKANGVMVQTAPATWSATDATYLGNIQTALDAATGVANGIVVSAIAATDPDLGFKLTFSGTGYAGLPQPMSSVAGTLPTSSTSANVVRTTTGVDGRMIAGAFVQPTDGSETIKTFIPNGTEKWVTNVDGVNVDIELPLVVIGGVVKSDLLINWPSDTSLRQYVVDAMKAFQGAVNFTHLAGW